jgi:pilus assembly protein CpaB
MGVNEISDVAGFVLPGNYVDVLLTARDDSGRPTSKILLNRVLVLAIAQDRLAQDEAKPKLASSVTLEVTPSQANQLDEGRSLGTLSLTLRNQSESNAAVVPTDDKLKKSISTENGVEVIRGTTVRIESGLRGK